MAAQRTAAVVLLAVAIAVGIVWAAESNAPLLSAKFPSLFPSLLKQGQASVVAPSADPPASEAPAPAPVGTSLAVAQSLAPVAAPVPSAFSRFGGEIPLVYVWFCGDVKKNQENLSWDTKKNCSATLSAHFPYAIAASLLHVPAVVLITDPQVGDVLKAKYPADVAAKLHVYDYLDYVDDKFWTIRRLYEENMKCCHGYKEPFEKWNVLNFFVFRTWLEKEAVPMAGFAEGDVVVLVPPFLPSGCQGEIAWRDKWDSAREWGPFTYCALGSMGGVLSLEMMNDWTDFNIALYGEHLWVQKAIAVHSFVHSINQMHTWYFYAMASLDYEGMPWSDGEPWYLQYIRRPPLFVREKQWMEKYNGQHLPYKNATLPPTKKLRICNGYFERDGFVMDSAGGWNMRKYVSSNMQGQPKTTIKDGRVSYVLNNVTIRNLHFQGRGKDILANTVVPVLKAHGGFKF